MATDTLDWWRGGIIYQIYPRSFADSRGNGWGDLNGIRAHLNYIASLGVDAGWISPFFKSPMKDFGYDVEDHRAVDPMFGSEGDFDALNPNPTVQRLAVFDPEVHIEKNTLVDIEGPARNIGTCLAHVLDMIGRCLRGVWDCVNAWVHIIQTHDL